MTFKEGVLKTVWDEVILLYPLNEGQNKQKQIKGKDKCGWLEGSTIFVNGIPYKSKRLNWVEYVLSYTHKDSHEKRFVHITNIEVDRDDVRDVLVFMAVYVGKSRTKVSIYKRTKAAICSTNIPVDTLVQCKTTTN